MSFDINAKHPAIVYAITSPYQSDTLSDSDREWAESMIEEGHRTKYYDLTPEQCEIINEYTAENVVHGMARLTFDYAAYRVGLEVRTMDIAQRTDPDTGEPVTDDEGEPVGDKIIPDHDFGCTVGQEGLTDCHGTPIPKGYCYFAVVNQSGNRPRTESNYKALKRRMLKWMLNGEQMIKDCLGMGVTEQHRCIARCLVSLEGVKQAGSKESEFIEPDVGPLVYFTDGVHPLAAITADTGKSNSGKDIFASDPQLLPVDMLETPESLTGNTPEKVYMTDRVGERSKALGKCESATKRALARMGGKNVNANIGDSNTATELAHTAVNTFLPDMDILTGHCYILQCPRFEKANTGGRVSKVQPVTPNDMAAALAVYSLRNEEPVDVFGVGRGRPVDDVSPIRFDVDEFTPLLEDIYNSSGTEASPVKEWLQARASGRYSNSPADKFAQLLRMVVAYFNPEEEVSTDLLRKDAYGPKQGESTGFYTVGGADIGPKPKKSKGSDDSEE